MRRFPDYFFCLTFLGIAVSACGGGGSGAPADPPLDPPRVFMDSTEETAYSGGELVVGINGEMGGLATRPDVSCTNNVVPTFSVSVWHLEIPGVSVLTESVCTATITDRLGRTASGRLTITILPETDIGQVVGIFDPPLKLVLPNFNLPAQSNSYGNHIVAIADPIGGGPIQVQPIGGDSSVPYDYYRNDIVTVEGEYTGIDSVKAPSLDAHGLPTASMTVVSSVENKIYYLLPESPSQSLTIREEININQPCYLQQTNTLRGDDLVVGQRNSGLSVVHLDNGSDIGNTESFSTALIQNIGNGRSFCHISRTNLPRSVTDPYPDYESIPNFDPIYARPLTAIDYDTLELVYYGDIDRDNLLEEIGTVPIETNSTSQLEIVQVISRGTYSQGTFSMLILLSDGNHIGEHRLVQIDNAAVDNTQRQQILHEWTEGVPVSMLEGAFGGSMDLLLLKSDLVVVLGTTEQSLFFENITPVNEVLDFPPEYAQPVQFDVGTGAGSAVAANRPEGPVAVGGESAFGVLVSYPGNGHVVYIDLSEIEL